MKNRLENIVLVEFKQMWFHTAPTEFLRSWCMSPKPLLGMKTV